MINKWVVHRLLWLCTYLVLFWCFSYEKKNWNCKVVLANWLQTLSSGIFWTDILLKIWFISLELYDYIFNVCLFVWFFCFFFFFDLIPLHALRVCFAGVEGPHSSEATLLHLASGEWGPLALAGSSLKANIFAPVMAGHYQLVGFIQTWFIIISLFFFS